MWDSEEEARLVGEDIEQLQRQGHSLDEMAILVRASFQMREFEERFITLGLPYRVVGGPRFYERLEIRDALAYLRCVAQPADDLAFERIVNTPKRGLGESTLQIVHEYARRSQIPMMQAARALVEIGGIEKPAAQAFCAPCSTICALVGARSTKNRIMSWPNRCWRNPAIPICWKQEKSAEAPRAGWKTSRNSSARWKNSPTSAPFSNMSRW